jgi:hypothetical protein
MHYFFSLAAFSTQATQRPNSSTQSLQCSRPQSRQAVMVFSAPFSTVMWQAVQENFTSSVISITSLDLPAFSAEMPGWYGPVSAGREL